LPTAPSLDDGEITDKGSINQRAVLRCRAELIRTLYTQTPPAEVIVV
jgi:feruloyl-CoA synthase